MVISILADVSAVFSRPISVLAPFSQIELFISTFGDDFGDYNIALGKFVEIVPWIAQLCLKQSSDKMKKLNRHTTYDDTDNTLKEK